MTDFLLELLSEEIPARMQDKARVDLERLFVAELDKAGLKADAITTYATPRRLALIARGLPLATQAVSEEVKGPRVGAPPQALDGFLRKTGLSADQLTERDGVYFAISEKPGRATAEVLGEAIPAIIRAFPWPKSMRWGDASASTESLRWVRPLHGIVALLGTEVVPCEIAGVTSGAVTRGHRFHATGPVTVESAATYADQLRAAHVIVDQDERRAIIRTRAAELAAGGGLSLIEDEGLVAENAGLTEWPVPLLGRFDEDFLSVPPEVIQLTARVNQKYFVCADEQRSDAGGIASSGVTGKLANAFICTANIVAADGGAKIVEGNRKVLAARLSDARFFYETDLKVPLSEQVKKLEKIVFHEQLGTVADKVARVAKLAEWLASEGIVPGCDPALARRAAELCKADLVTGMVGEFPELQGLMGGYYAAAQGEDPAVAEAIRDHYKPVGQGDDVPTAPVTVAVSLADKLDTLACFFAIDERPTGSKDPFALRRAVIGIISLLLSNQLRLPLRLVAALAAANYLLPKRPSPLDRVLPALDVVGALKTDFRWAEIFDRLMAGAIRLSAEDDRKIAGAIQTTALSLLDFFADRLKVQQREAGVRHDLIDAVFALGGEDDLVRLLARVHALQAFMATEDGANLLAGYKRAANILKKEDYDAFRAALTEEERNRAPEAYDHEPAEDALIAALDAAEPRAAAAIEAEDFEGAMSALASLRGPIDAFFADVTVNDPVPPKRAARLALLARLRDAVHRVADFSKIEG